ncbi:MAG: NADH-quinone oxidoreductase subunit J/K, partial [Candidatus Omnitrophota bacterium]
MYKKTLFIKDTDTQAADRTKEFYNKFLECLRSKNLQNDIQIVRAADIGVYNQGVVLRVYGEDMIYVQLKETDIDDIVSLTIEKGELIKSLQYKKKDKQLRRVLRNCGAINPDSIEDYLASEGYQGLYKILTQLKPAEVIQELKISGLRGRGGGGFPTWMKWDFALKTESDQKYIICNGDEGDPGAYMDRSVLEGDPHSVMEGMIIAGYAIGASKGYFYIRAEYPLAIKRIQNAIDQAYSLGLLG